MNDEVQQGTRASGVEAKSSEAKAAPLAHESSVGSAFFSAEVRRFEELIRKDPAYAYRRCGLALLYSLPGRTMVSQLQKFGWKAQSAQDLFNCGALRSETGDHKGALKYYEKAVEIDPQHWSSYLNLALTYRQLSEPRKARAAMQKCVKILEEKSELYSWEKRDLEGARRFLEGQ